MGNTMKTIIYQNDYFIEAFTLCCAKNPTDVFCILDICEMEDKRGNKDQRTQWVNAPIIYCLISLLRAEFR
jgi:hypothetical protein